ncbi:hypothetical protein ACFQJD_12455 [Haloplanus sp. GCM10025708]|uniref:hypothetical protein n=1 Tax=Haloferacaceae TaxID=1644056 RepID=UPI003606DAB3
MIRRLASRSSALDVSLLGVIVAVVSFYSARLSPTDGTSPNLIRFFDTAPSREYPAVLPQDKALLLLLDPGTGPTTAASTGPATGGVWPLLFLVGLLMVVAGPILAWLRRGA